MVNIVHYFIKVITYYFITQNYNLNNLFDYLTNNG